MRTQIINFEKRILKKMYNILILFYKIENMLKINITLFFYLKILIYDYAEKTCPERSCNFFEVV